MTATKYRIRLTGNWCDGWWWEVVNPATNRTRGEPHGPYHSLAQPRRVAWDDAVDYARQFDLLLESETNPYTNE